MKAINPNLSILYRGWKEGFKGVVLLGSSRSGKTISTIFFLIFVCSKNWVQRQVDKTVKALDILVVRETYNSHKTTLYKDFNLVLPMFRLRSPFENVLDRSTFKLFGCRFTLMGADNMSDKMGAGSDIIWLNEGMHVPKSVFDQLEMRARMFFIIDSNPEESEHWIFDNVIPRKDVLYLRTTYKDNPHCPPAQRKKIESYEPWLPGSYEVTDQGVTYLGDPISESNQPPAHPTNVEEGTADEMMWLIFGLGLKAEKKGRIYKKLYRYTDVPENAWFVGYGGDFGFNPDPTVIVAVWKLDNNLYIKQLVYGIELDPEKLSRLMREAGIKSAFESDSPDDVVMDSAEPITISYLKVTQRFRIWKPKKGAGSVQQNIRLVSQFKLHIHADSKNVYHDFENFCWKWNDQTDKPTGEPEKTHKHSPDAVAYLLGRQIGREG